MIDQEQITWESQFAIVYFRSKAIPCQTCGKQPDHDYQPGSRLIWCGGKSCKRSITDSGLVDGFSDWNTMQNNLAMHKRKS